MSVWARRGLVLTLGLTLAGWAATAVCLVAPGEVVVVRRLGRLVEPAWSAGLHVGWPIGLERRDRVRVDEIRRLAVGSPADVVEELGEYLTGDHNLILARVLVQYRVAEPSTFVLVTIDGERVLSDLANEAVGRALAREPVEGILRDRREELAALLRERIGVEAKRLGVEVVAVQFAEVRPPEEVAAEFTAAQAAASDRDRRRREGEEEAARIAAGSQSRAAVLTERARGEASERESAARVKASRFGSILSAYRAEPELTVRRLYLETLGSLFEGVGRTMVIGPGEPVDLGLDAPR